MKEQVLKAMKEAGKPVSAGVLFHAGLRFRLSNSDVCNARSAVGVGTGEGEDFVKLFAEGGGEGEAVEFQLIVAFAEAHDGCRVVGVHHPDLLAHDQALVSGMFLLPALKLNGPLPRLVLLRFRFRFGLKAFLNNAEVFEVGEFQASSGVS